MVFGAHEILCHLIVLHDNILAEKRIFLKKIHIYFVQRSQIESQLNGADSWDLIAAQWNILLKYQEIITKYFIVL